jgi:hypothetical protein
MNPKTTIHRSESPTRGHELGQQIHIQPSKYLFHPLRFSQLLLLFRQSLKHILGSLLNTVSTRALYSTRTVQCRVHGCSRGLAEWVSGALVTMSHSSERERGVTPTTQLFFVKIALRSGLSTTMSLGVCGMCPVSTYQLLRHIPVYLVTCARSAIDKLQFQDPQN